MIPNESNGALSGAAGREPESSWPTARIASRTRS